MAIADLQQPAPIEDDFADWDFVQSNITVFIFYTFVNNIIIVNTNFVIIAEIHMQ